jgi:heme A synthase
VVLLARRCLASGERRFRTLAWAAVLLAVAQIALGAATVLTARAVTPTTAHVATGAALLGACWLAALRSFRRLVPARGDAGGLAAAPAASA